jgi:CheY-like chemotaxis protein
MFENALTMLTGIKKILYCDDDEDDHLSFREALQKVQPGIELVSVSGAEELFLHLKSGNYPDIIFLDINIPGRNGLECLKTLKTSQELKDIRVVMHSTASGTFIEQSYALGANLYIPKPLSLLVYPIIIQKVFLLDWPQFVPQPPFRKFLLSESFI